jgi:exopolyphosphatase/guanosine-5'-triphosphate,3'-diphosphate pyrophosphatase
MRVGIIDIGSNSVLLLVGERVESGWRILMDTARITRLGEGFSAEKRLQPQAIERTLRAIDEYLSICRALGVERVLAVATAAVREARNQEAFLDALRRRLPVFHADGFTSPPPPPQDAC